MPENHYKKNRKMIQKAAIESKFLVRLSENDLPYRIVEKKIDDTEDNKLRIANIYNIPTCNEISFVLDLELEMSLFSSPQHHKKVEKAIIVFSTWSIYVILIEMKSTLKLHNDGIQKIEQKIKDSIGRITLFLSHYLLDDSKFDDYPIDYFALILYNVEHISSELHKNPKLKSNDLVRIFNNDRDSYTFHDDLGTKNKVKVHFIQNNNRNEEMNIYFEQIFANDNDFENAINSDKTLPYYI